MHFSKQMLGFVKGERKDARLLSDEVRQVREVLNATELTICITSAGCIFSNCIWWLFAQL